MRQYLALVEHIRENGSFTHDRTGVGTYSVFGHQMRFNLRHGFPLVTSKYTWFKGVVHELLWILRGETNIASLQRAGVHIWDEWADGDGNLGPVYGAQWRAFRFAYENLDSESDQEWIVGEVDQLRELITNLRDNPFSRRHIISAWAPGELPSERYTAQENVRNGRMALAPCHCLVQFHVRKDVVTERNVLSCQLYQRSADVYLGVPFNIASYALLTRMLAYHLGYDVGDFIWSGGDCHLYANHMERVDVLLKRGPYLGALPAVSLNYPPEVLPWNVQPEMIELIGYQHNGKLPAPVAV